MFSGAAAALLPASCGGTTQTGSQGGGGTGGTASTSTSTGTGGTTGTGGKGTGGKGTGGKGTGGKGTGGTGTGGMPADAGDEMDGTLVDLDGEADSPYIPPDGGTADADAS